MGQDLPSVLGGQIGFLASPVVSSSSCLPVLTVRYTKTMRAMVDTANRLVLMTLSMVYIFPAIRPRDRGGPHQGRQGIGHRVPKR